MNNDRAATDYPEPSAGNAWTRFWFTPIVPTGLRCLRVLSGLLFCAYLLSFLGHQKEFFSQAGWIDTEAVKAIQSPDVQRPEFQRQRNLPTPMVGWSIFFQAGDNVALFQAMYFGSLAVLIAFTLGLATRITGVLTWVIVASFVGNPAISYEGDDLLAILAFYLMIGHLLVGQWSGNLSWVERFLGLRSDFVFARWIWPNDVSQPSHGVNLALRVLQIHFVVIILFSAIHKLQMMEWLAGVALWYPLNPTFKTTLESLQRAAPNADSTLFLLSLIAYGVLAWQLALPAFAWRTGRAWRVVLLGGAALGWAGSYFVFQLPSFGPFVMIGALSFLNPDEWAWILERLSGLKGSVAASKSEPIPEKVAVAAGKETNIKK